MVLSKLSYHTPPGKVIVKRAPGPSTLHIRWQAIRMYYENERWQDIERTTGFSERTMRRWLAEGAARQTVMVTLPNSGKHALSQRAQRELVEILEHDPQLYYDELRFLVYARTNEVASLSTIRRVAIKNGFRIKVAQPVSSYRNARTMQLHAELRAQYHWTQFIYVDEAHKAGKNLARKRGKVRKGRTCFVPLTSHLSRSWTMVAAMNHQGLVGHHIQELGRGDGPLPHAITRELWLEMFKAKILPHLGNADLGEENSVVIIDNASLHWGSDDDCMLNELDELVRSRGAVLLYTPPYCPRANAIEAMFKGMNDFIRRERHLAEADPAEAIRLGLLSGGEHAHAFVMRSEKDVAGWLDGAGKY